MVLALYVVAGVMVLGGLLAIYSGSDIIVMERGWTMVISGSVMAASGALLAGIAVAARRLGRILDEVANLREWAAQIDTPAPATEAETETEPSADYSASSGDGNPGPAMPTADLGALAASLEAVSPKNERVAETDDKPPGSEPAARELPDGVVGVHAVGAAAVRNHVGAHLDLVQSCRQIRHRHRERAADVSCRVLRFRTHVEDHHVPHAQTRAQLVPGNRMQLAAVPQVVLGKLRQVLDVLLRNLPHGAPQRRDHGTGQ
jgi:hypothetical protein